MDPNGVGHNLAYWLDSNTSANLEPPPLGGQDPSNPDAVIMQPNSWWGINDIVINMDDLIWLREQDEIASGGMLATDPPILLLEEDLWGLRWLSDAQRITISINTRNPATPIEFPDLSGLANLQELNFTGFNFVQTPTIAATIAQRIPPSLQVLDLSNTNLAGVWDFTGAPPRNNLQTLNLSNNGLTTLIITNNMPAMQTLDVSNNQLTNLSIMPPSTNELRTIIASFNNLTSFPDLTTTNFTMLETLQLDNNSISTFSAANHSNLVNLDLSQNVNTLTNVSLINLPQLATFSAWDSLSLSSATFQNLPNLNAIFIQRNALTSLDVSNLPSLQLLNASENDLDVILLDGSNNLQDIRLFANNLTNVNIPPSPATTQILLQRNNLTAFGVEGFPNLQNLGLSYNFIPYSGRIPQITGDWQTLFGVADPGTDTQGGWALPVGFVFFPQWAGSVLPPPPPPPNTININGVPVPFTQVGGQIQLNMTTAEITAINLTTGAVVVDLIPPSISTSVTIPQAAWSAFSHRAIEIRFFNGIVNLNAAAVANIAAQHVGTGPVVVELNSPALASLTPPQQAAIQVGNDILRTLQIMAGTNPLAALTAGNAAITVPTPFNVPHTAHHIAANGVLTTLAAVSAPNDITFNSAQLGLFAARATTAPPPTASIMVNGVTVPITVTGTQMHLNLDTPLVAAINATGGAVVVDITTHSGITSVTLPQLAWAAFSHRAIEIRLFNGIVNLNALAVANVAAQHTGTAAVIVELDSPALPTLPAAQQAALQPATDTWRRLQITAGANLLATLSAGNATITIPTPFNVPHTAHHIAANGVTTALTATSAPNNITFNSTTLGLFAARSGVVVPPTASIIINGVAVPFTQVGAQMQLNPDTTMIAAINATAGAVVVDVTTHGAVTSVTLPQVAWAAFVNRAIEIRFFNGTINLNAAAVANISAQHIGSGAVVVEFDSPMLAALTPQQQTAIIAGSDFWRRVQIMAGTNNLATLSVGNANITIPTPFNVSHTVHHLAANGVSTTLVQVSAAANINFNSTALGVFVVRTAGVTPPPTGATNITVNGVPVALTRIGEQVNIAMPAALVQDIARNAITNTVSFFLGNQHGATQAAMPTEAVQLFANSGYALEFVLPDGTLQLDTVAAQSVAQQTNAANVAFRLENMAQGDMTSAQAHAVNPNNVVIRVQLLNGNLPIPNIHGFATITVPIVGVQNPGAWHIAPDGTRTQLDTVVTGDSVSFRANRFSLFEVGINSTTPTSPASPSGVTIAPMTFEIGGQQPPTPAPTQPPEQVVIPPAPPEQVVIPPAPTQPPQVAVTPTQTPAPAPEPTPAPVAPRPNPQTEDAPLPVSATIISISAIVSSVLIVGIFLLCRKKFNDRKKTQKFIEMRDKTL